MLSDIKKHMKTFWPFVIPYKRKFILILLFLLGTTILSLLPPLIIKFLLDEVFTQKSYSLLYLVIGAFFAIQLLAGVIKIFMEYWHEYVGAWMIFDIRAYFYNHIQSLSVDFFSKVKHGDILSRLKKDVASIHSIISIVLTNILPDSLQITGILCILLYLNWKLTLLSLVFVPIFYITLSIFGKKLKILAKLTREKDAVMTSFFMEILKNILVVKLFDRGKYELNRHKEKSIDFINVSLKMHVLKFISVFVIGLISTMSLLIVLGYGGYLVINDILTIGGLIAFYTYISKLFAPLRRFASYGVSIYSSLASVDRIKEFLDIRPSIIDSPNAKDLVNCKGKISFANVHFSYLRGENNSKVNGTLEKISFTINPGEHIALVGETGSGKSTTINLLCRLYDVDAGLIEIDDINIKDLSISSLCDNIAFVTQEDLLFGESIESNIKYGQLEASDSEVRDVANLVELNRVIEKSPERMKTLIGPQGCKLSGGERKKLMMARALIKNASIIIFDEATSSMDTHTEEIIQKNLNSYVKNKTVITIAHRHSSIISADKIIVLDHGQIIGIGTHSELLNENAVYRNLFEKQFKADPITESKHFKEESAVVFNGALNE